MQHEVKKQVHPGTREKRYISVVNGKHLRLSWTRQSYAKIYARAVRDRYIRKLIALANSQKAKSQQE